MVEHLLRNKHMERGGESHTHRGGQGDGERDTEWGRNEGERGDSNRPIIPAFKMLMQDH